MAHILVVDDDQDIREVLQLILEGEGHTVLLARDGQEALDCLLTSQVRLVVLLDVNMPKMNGLEVLQLVADDPELSARHVYILLTARRDYESTSTITDTLSRLAIPVILKPFDIDRLMSTVDIAARSLEEPPSSLSVYAP